MMMRDDGDANTWSSPSIPRVCSSNSTTSTASVARDTPILTAGYGYGQRGSRRGSARSLLLRPRAMRRTSGVRPRNRQVWLRAEPNKAQRTAQPLVPADRAAVVRHHWRHDAVVEELVEA